MNGRTIAKSLSLVGKVFYTPLRQLVEMDSPQPDSSPSEISPELSCRNI
jgi:hypothetical protein